MEKKSKGNQEVSLSDAYSLFVYAIRTQITRDYYLRRLRTFFDFIKLDSNSKIEQRCNLFADNGRQDPNWAFNSILKFILAEKQRVESKKITGGTLRILNDN
jgi:hypothetical protein